ncbi:RtcB family protein [Selenomonas sp. F0473]|uniref:RtcB family protein n=1 Tax=Selenomonas sp. F0473 TaxID=999423 RepID=UPI0025D50DD5|nr:RtcB family protein [Selenomonas sp. F0473]
MAGEEFHTIHNYINMEERILRKGAIEAHADERVLIRSICATGASSPSGAAIRSGTTPRRTGRLMSRTAAKDNLSMEEFRKTMPDVYTTAVNENTLDEALMAYKSLSDIIDVIEVLKPIYNFKAG